MDKPVKKAMWRKVLIVIFAIAELMLTDSEDSIETGSVADRLFKI